jgi:hypothetical protein
MVIILIIIKISPYKYIFHQISQYKNTKKQYQKLHYLKKEKKKFHLEVEAAKQAARPI